MFVPHFSQLPFAPVVSYTLVDRTGNTAPVSEVQPRPAVLLWGLPPAKPPAPWGLKQPVQQPAVAGSRGFPSVTVHGAHLKISV